MFLCWFLWLKFQSKQTVLIYAKILNFLLNLLFEMIKMKLTWKYYFNSKYYFIIILYYIIYLFIYLFWRLNYKQIQSHTRSMIPLLEKRNFFELNEPMVFHHDNITNPTISKVGLEPSPLWPQLKTSTIQPSWHMVINIILQIVYI